MNLDLSDDQRMLKDSINRLIAQNYSLDQRREYAGATDGWSREMWSAFADLGLLMLPFDEVQGGLGLGAVETMLIGEAFGRALVIEPYLACVVLAGTAIARFGSPEQRERLLAPIMAGATIAAYADRGEVSAVRAGADWRLSGRVDLVLAGDSADLIVLRSAAGMFVVPADAAGVTRRGYSVHGGGNAADVTLADVAIGDDARLKSDLSVDTILEAGIAFLAAEAAGAMQAALDTTVDYIKTREQFGKPIGANQALQHRAAEMLVEVEQARSAAIYAALLADEPDAEERAKGYAAVKAVIGKSGRFVAQQTIQLHGGIGVSEEHVASHYFRRLTAIGMLLGDTDYQVGRLAALGGFTSRNLPSLA